MTGPEWLSVSMPYVVPRSPQDGDAWAEDATQQGGVGSQRLLEVAKVVPAVEVAEALQVQPGALVVVRRRLMLLNDQPVELTDSYYPASIASGTALAEPRKIRGGAIGLLAELGYRPGQVREDVYTREPDAAERRLLNLTGQDWVLGLTRLLSTRQGVPIEASVMTMVPQGRRLRYELTID
ncbi:UTRA domain-containing protein [Micromonospora purpureochromogenes]|uniref:UTRA domain-containing protein n=1 Tax=Micromonospora purpureochromogenes TaxID=47872 RepID=A0A1C4UHJ6_9ACTN|nr:UTRA domain-containing protein [Micromonospora purpureochromogenes]SCE71137.1 UTRA domain-containing protein [Micromonospora purpureochromogenes]